MTKTYKIILAISFTIEKVSSFKYVYDCDKYVKYSEMKYS